MVALCLQDLWAAGVGPSWALRLLGQRTQGCAANQLAALGATSRRRSKQRITELQNGERRIRNGAGEFLARASTGGSTGERSCGKLVQISKLACNSHEPA